MMMEVDQLPSEEARETGVCRMVDPCAFYVVRVPQAVFSTDPEETLRPEFEAVFRAYSSEVRFSYLRSFGRVRVTYPSPEQSELAQENLNRQLFQGTSMRFIPVKPFIIGSQTLGLPAKTKQHVLSPPASPPVDWEQSEEKAPSPGGFVDYSLVTALASLQLPGNVQEFAVATPTTPSIVVITPEDNEMDLMPSALRDHTEPHITLSSLPPELRHTARPPNGPPA